MNRTSFNYFIFLQMCNGKYQCHNYGSKQQVKPQDCHCSKSQRFGVSSTPAPFSSYSFLLFSDRKIAQTEIQIEKLHKLHSIFLDAR